ncbi:MAG: hypothetical protein HYY23_16255 [Verrucomicrobia bacterium]|nr:hypothetical protein [Verrucomicrobiota bacterium]
MTERDDAQLKPEEAKFNETRPPYHTAVPEGIYPLRTPEDQGWEEFRDQCRRQMQRPLELRIRYGFCRRIKPASDPVSTRIFKTMPEYRAWCEENLPDYLGFKRPAQ